MSAVVYSVFRKKENIFRMGNGIHNEGCLVNPNECHLDIISEFRQTSLLQTFLSSLDLECINVGT